MPGTITGSSLGQSNYYGTLSPVFIEFPPPIIDARIDNIIDQYEGSESLSAQGFLQSATVNGQIATIPYVSKNLIGNLTGIGTLWNELNGQALNRFLKELPGSGKIKFGEEVVATRIFDVPWEWSNVVMANLMGGMVAFDNNGFPKYSLPDIFSGDYPFLICMDVDSEPFTDLHRGIDNDNPPRIQYERTKITATYRPWDYDMTIEGAGKIFSVPKSNWSWVGFSLQDIANQEINSAQNGIVSNDIPLVVPNGELTLTRRMFLPSMVPLLMALEGKLNYYSFLGYPPGTLQLQSVSSKTSWLPSGQNILRIHCKFLHDPHTHVAFLNALGNPSTTVPPAGNNPGGVVAARSPGYQFIQFSNKQNAFSLGPLTGSPLLDFQGNTIINDTQPQGPGLELQIWDFGMPHKFADFNVLLNFL